MLCTGKDVCKRVVPTQSPSFVAFWTCLRKERKVRKLWIFSSMTFQGMVDCSADNIGPLHHAKSEKSRFGLQ